MQAPTSRYGCGALDCVPCYGDEEWQEETWQYECQDCDHSFTLADARKDSWTPEEGSPRCPECHSYDVL